MSTRFGVGDRESLTVSVDLRWSPDVAGAALGARRALARQRLSWTTIGAWHHQFFGRVGSETQREASRIHRPLTLGFCAATIAARVLLLNAASLYCGWS